MFAQLSDPSPPFEGPEKLLELWFAPSTEGVPGARSANDGKYGLRKVKKSVWEEMLDTVRCKVLSVIEGAEMDAYLLSESSLIISPHRLILKTCGTTLNLLGLPRILEIARCEAGLPTVFRCFYSHKRFMFPERQQGLHRAWNEEVGCLDNLFKNGAAYSIGRTNGDHWMLYIASPSESDAFVGPRSLDQIPGHLKCVSPTRPPPDYTIEILMTQLADRTRAAFFAREDAVDTPREAGLRLSSKMAISDIFPSCSTTLDAYSFVPCGFSANALIKWEHDTGHGPARGDGYHTIHVTPEEGWSYASFECNVPLATKAFSGQTTLPDLETLIQRVVNIFQPGRLTLTLFISNEHDPSNSSLSTEAAQRAFKAALTAPFGPSSKQGYNAVDQINYTFKGYDLAFATYETAS